MKAVFVKDCTERNLQDVQINLGNWINWDGKPRHLKKKSLGYLFEKTGLLYENNNVYRWFVLWYSISQIIIYLLYKVCTIVFPDCYCRLLFMFWSLFPTGLGCTNDSPNFSLNVTKVWEQNRDIFPL